MNTTTEERHPSSLTYSTGFYSVRFVDERVRYLNHLLTRGWAINTLRGVANRITALAARVDIAATCGVTASEIEAAADNWLQNGRRNFRRKVGSHRSRTTFITYGKNWLKFLGVLSEQQSSGGPYSELLEEYEKFLESDKGLAFGSVQAHIWRLRKFLTWLHEQHVGLENLTLKEVHRFLSASPNRSYSRRTIAGLASTIRGFLRYAEIGKHCPPNIAKGIDAPPIYSQETLPAGPSWNLIQTLIGQIGTEDPKDIRDRAVIMLLAVYGFRIGEVCRLRLEDLNWDQELIRLTRGKISSQQLYPLVPEVGDAILLYLQKARPKSNRREVFLRTLPPFERLTIGGFSKMVSNRLHALNVELPHYGPHVFVTPAPHIC